MPVTMTGEPPRCAPAIVPMRVHVIHPQTHRVVHPQTPPCRAAPCSINRVASPAASAIVQRQEHDLLVKSVKKKREMEFQARQKEFLRRQDLEKQCMFSLRSNASRRRPLLCTHVSTAVLLLPRRR